MRSPCTVRKSRPCLLQLKAWEQQRRPSATKTKQNKTHLQIVSLDQVIKSGLSVVGFIDGTYLGHDALRSTQPCFCEISAKDAQPQSNYVETTDKPHWRTLYKMTEQFSAKVWTSWMRNNNGRKLHRLVVTEETWWLHATWILNEKRAFRTKPREIQIGPVAQLRSTVPTSVSWF